MCSLVAVPSHLESGCVIWIRSILIIGGGGGKHEFMRKIVTRTVQDLAANFLVKLKSKADAPLTWDQIRTSFYKRFRNYVDAQIAQHKLKKS